MNLNPNQVMLNPTRAHTKHDSGTGTCMSCCVAFAGAQVCIRASLASLFRYFNHPLRGEVAELLGGEATQLLRMAPLGRWGGVSFTSGRVSGVRCVWMGRGSDRHRFASQLGCCADGYSRQFT
ncbi:hypothetical protein M758_3G035800 [Ceratodon purpureus]|nr:hypothetical protein M758_3G035800 [Ceratodon purpureus]